MAVPMVRFVTEFKSELGEAKSHIDEMPLLGFGTYKVGCVPASATGAGGEQPQLRPAEEVLTDAVVAGYGMFDCAQFYENEHIVGTALQKACETAPFIISKVWTSTMWEGPEAVVAQFEKTRKELCVDFLHVYLIHWPLPQGKHVEAYKALQPLVLAGKIRHLGVSNYTVEDYQELMGDSGVFIKPVLNQIEINPKMCRQKTLDFFKSEGVHMQAYRGLGNGGLMQNQDIVEIADRCKRTPSQVLGRWLIQQGISHVPKSEKLERMRENAAIFDFELSEDDCKLLSGLTDEASIQTFKTTYEKCRVRDTPMEKSAGRADYTSD